MTYEPSDVMVEAAARALCKEQMSQADQQEILDWQDFIVDARAALRAAFAAAIEAGEASLVTDQTLSAPALILRTQEGEK